MIESVGSSAGAKRIVESAVDTFRRIDILVNNAGAFQRCDHPRRARIKVDQVINVQLDGVFHCTQHAARQMVAQGNGGVIINMYGGSGWSRMYGQANHCATKGLHLGASRSWAYELWPHRIRVNAVRAMLRWKPRRGSSGRSAAT